MKARRYGVRLMPLGLCLVFGAVVGCTGSTDGGGEDFSDSSFVASDDAAGSINLEVTTTSMSVSETSGFSVAVKDANGGPVQQIAVSCDTEEGLAIIEPTTGSEITDNFGQISGRIGCAAPGSFQFACRLPIGANKRKFATIKCIGPTPAGFGGFGDTAGGGLGGGSGGVADQLDDVHVTQVEFLDGSGDTPSLGIDTSQVDCVVDDPITGVDETEPEPFFNSRVRITVENNSNATITFTRMTYTVPDADGAGNSFTSDPISFIGEAGPNGDVSSFTTLFANASGGSKFFPGSATAIPTSLGFQNVTIRLTGENELGDEVIVSGTAAVDFSNFNNCS